MIDEMTSKQTTTAKVPSSGQGPSELLALLQATYAVFREGKALALGIHKAILTRQPELDRNALRQALKVHTASTRYLKALATETDRFDLDGRVEGVVTAEHRDLAAATLRERLRKRKETQVKQARADEDVRRQAEQEQQRLAKLQELAKRFARR